jgi:hypothetical protein
MDVDTGSGEFRRKRRCDAPPPFLSSTGEATPSKRRKPIFAAASPSAAEEDDVHHGVPTRLEQWIADGARASAPSRRRQAPAEGSIE